VTQPKETIITRWAQEPFYWGAYSYMAVGSTSADLEQLAEPVASKLFWAGEATHQVGLCMSVLSAGWPAAGLLGGPVGSQCPSWI
jgi:hypothetical protein